MQENLQRGLEAARKRAAAEMKQKQQEEVQRTGDEAASLATGISNRTLVLPNLLSCFLRPPSLNGWWMHPL